jgi:hypothetical protein
MSAQIAKSSTLMLKLKEELRQKLPSFVQTDNVDSNGYPTLLLSADSTPAAGEQNMFIRITTMSSPFVDSIGQSQSVYGPHVIQSVEEASTISGVSLLTLANRSKIDWCITRAGCQEEKYLRANGAAPGLSDITSGNLVSKVADAYFALSHQ